MRKIPKKNINDIFHCIKLVEDIYYDQIKQIEIKQLHCFDDGYELAIVDGEVVGIGYINKSGKTKIIYHRQ